MLLLKFVMQYDQSIFQTLFMLR